MIFIDLIWFFKIFQDSSQPPIRIKKELYLSQSEIFGIRLLNEKILVLVFYEFFTSGITHLIRVFQNRTLDGLDQIPDPFVGRNGELDIQIDRPPIEEHHRHNQHHQQMVIQPARVTRQNRVQQNIRLVREILADRSEYQIMRISNDFLLNPYFQMNSLVIG